MNFQLSPEQFRIMILYDWKIALTYKDCHAPLVKALREQRTFQPQSLIAFVSFSAINLVFKILLVQIILHHLLLNKQLMLYEK